MTQTEKNVARILTTGSRGHTIAGAMLFARALATLIFIALIAGGLATAQTTGRGNITGTISDSQGAVVAGARVTVTNTATGVSSSTLTNSTGYFEVDSIDAGAYSVSVEAPGFAELNRQGLVLYASNVLTLPLTLSVGKSTQVVTVSGEAPLLNTESGLTGQSLTTRELLSLPAADDDPYQFVEIAPGVQSPAGITQANTQTGALNWNGVSKYGTAGVTNSNEFDLDGATNMGNTRGFALSLGMDETDEVRVDTSAFDPTIGHTFGVTVTETTKAGTNQLHGSATVDYGALRWDALNRFQSIAYQYHELKDGCTNGPATSPTCYRDENTYAWTGGHEELITWGIGGPVFFPKLFNGRNKLFWFFGGTEDPSTTSSPSVATIPTVQERSGNFSDMPTAAVPANYLSTFQSVCGTNTPFYGQYQIYDPYSVTIVNGHPSRTPICGNVLPSNRLLNPGMATLVNSWLPTTGVLSPSTNPTGNYYYSAPSPGSSLQLTYRVDYAPTESDRIFARYSSWTSWQNLGGLIASGADTRVVPKWVYIGALGWNHVFSAETNLDVTLAGSSMETTANHYPGYSAFPPSSAGLPSYLQNYAGSSATFPMLEFGSNAYAQGTSGANNSLFGNLNDAPSYYRNLNIRVNLMHLQGKHSFRVGGEWRAQNFARAAMGNSSGIFNFDTTYTQQNDGSNVDCAGGCNYGLASPSNTALSYAAFLMGVQTQSQATLGVPISISTPYSSAYFGDTWRVTPKLTLMPGIRFEEEYGPKEKHNRQIAEFDPNQSLAIAGPATAAYATSLAGATATQLEALPSTITVQGGPLYAGVNGAPLRQWTSDFRVLPRIGASYQLPHQTVLHAGYGIFFDTLNALEFSGSPTDQTNFSSSTTDATNSYYGNWGQNLSTGAPPISNPFPVTNGANFIPALGASAGNLSYVGASPTIYPHNYAPARAQRVDVGVQHQFAGNFMVDVSWLGSWTTHMSNFSSGVVNAGGGANTKNLNLASVPQMFYTGGVQPNVFYNSLLNTTVGNPLALANFVSLQSSNPSAYTLMSHSNIFTNATTQLKNLVHPYPFMGGLSEEDPIGQSHFQELLVTVAKHMSHGIDFMAALQKNYQYDRDIYLNPFDTAMSWEPSNSSYPTHLTAEAVYELPFGHGKRWANSGLASAILGGFTANGTYEASNGTLLEMGNGFYIGQIRASDIMLKHPTYNTSITPSGYTAYVQWLNPGNVATATENADGSCTYSGTGFVANPNCQPNSYNLRAIPPRINGVRQQPINNLMASVQKAISLREGVALELRFDAANALNHQMLGTPNETYTSSQFGQISSTQDNARFLTAQAHVRF